MRTVGEDEGITGTVEDLGFMPAEEGSHSWSSFKLGVQNLQQEGRMRGLGGPVVMTNGRSFFASEAKGIRHEGNWARYKDSQASGGLCCPLVFVIFCLFYMRQQHLK